MYALAVLAIFIFFILIAIVIHILLKKVIKNKKIKPFIGIIAFIIIIFLPISLANILRVYYSLTEAPFYKEIKKVNHYKGPTYNENKDIQDFDDYVYEGHLDFKMDTKYLFTDEHSNRLLKETFGEEKIEKYKKEGFAYLRYSVKDYGLKDCVYPNKDLYKLIEKDLKEKKYSFRGFKSLYGKQKKCIAVEFLKEEDVKEKLEFKKRYEYKTKTIRSGVIFEIPGIVQVYYTKKYYLFERATNEPLAWRKDITIYWDMYGFGGYNGFPYYVVRKGFKL